ncbi:GTP cyclohydrolase II [Aliikangiella sp. IMCC44359]|uniref:GTP cyclohydrolase II n=1 Tax=Aliikangiella sp. IMCC44359 TaxID=3459125 RepID=UPI00403B04EA
MSNSKTISAKLPTKWGDFTIHSLEKFSDDKEHIALVMGDLTEQEPVLVRIHSECLTGDAFSSLRCDCGPQLDAAMQKIAEEKRGVIVYLRQEGRGIGLINKIKAYALQDDGLDTVEANINLGFKADQRNFKVAADMLKHLNVNKVSLMTNNPRKVAALEAANIEVVERVPLKFGRNPHNESYLLTKHGKLGHLLDDND